MASAFTHVFVAGAFGKAYSIRNTTITFWMLTVLCCLLPDVDVLGFTVGIRYNSVLGHRGFTHSLLFAALMSLLVAVLAFKTIPRFSRSWWGLWAYFFLVGASHGVLDAMTDRGSGVGFFMPFDTSRYFLSWRPLHTSPLSIARFFSPYGWHVLMSEMIWIWLPVSLVVSGIRFYRKRNERLRNSLDASPPS